jgi:hypothetical protein
MQFAREVGAARALRLRRGGEEDDRQRDDRCNGQSKDEPETSRGSDRAAPARGASAARARTREVETTRLS